MLVTASNAYADARKQFSVLSSSLLRIRQAMYQKDMRHNRRPRELSEINASMKRAQQLFAEHFQDLNKRVADIGVRSQCHYNQLRCDFIEVKNSQDNAIQDLQVKVNGCFDDLEKDPFNGLARTATALNSEGVRQLYPSVQAEKEARLSQGVKQMETDARLTRLEGQHQVQGQIQDRMQEQIDQMQGEISDLMHRYEDLKADMAIRASLEERRYVSLREDMAVREHVSEAQCDYLRTFVEEIDRKRVDFARVIAKELLRQEEIMDLDLNDSQAVLAAVSDHFGAGGR